MQTSRRFTLMANHCSRKIQQDGTEVRNVTQLLSTYDLPTYFLLVRSRVCALFLLCAQMNANTFQILRAVLLYPPGGPT